MIGIQSTLTKQIKKRLSFFTLLLLYFAVTGCASHQTLTGLIDSKQAIPATWHQLTITSHDGTLITATLYQPALAEGETTPLIIHTHGFGGSRAPRPLSVYGKLVISGEAAIAAWKSGYWVLSYDQRGFGNSGGDIHLMDPDYEVKDMIAVIDWAEKNIPRVDRDEHGDIKLGTVGESYGGAVQLLTSLQDSRIDALVPIATWYDLGDSMAPNGHIKSAWGSALVSLGSVMSGFDFPMLLQDEYVSLASGSINEQVSADLQKRSMSFYCDQGQSIQGDALFIQGLRDTLFPLNQGIKNWQCAKRGGHHAQLIGIQDGHILPWPTQSWSGMPIFNTQSEVTCGNYHAQTTDMIVQWWDKKLRGKETTNTTIPEVCITQSDDEGTELSDVTTGGQTYNIQQTDVKLVQTGWFESLLQPMEWLIDQVMPTQAFDHEKPLTTSGGMIRPAFIPLKQITQSTKLIGVPTIDLSLITTDEERKGTAYVALGVKRNGSPYIEIINDQFTPLPGDGQYQIELPAVSRQLHENETIGLVVQGFTGQYFLNPEGWLDFATISGQINLPFHIKSHPSLPVHSEYLTEIADIH